MGIGNIQLDAGSIAVWSDDRSQDDVTYVKLLEPTTDNFSLLGKTVYAIFDAVLDVSVKGLMFPYDDAEKMLEENQEWLYKLPDLFGSMRLVGQYGDRTAQEVDCDSDRSGPTVNTSTHFDVSGATVGEQCHQRGFVYKDCSFETSQLCEKSHWHSSR
jgi:hypothetical protein